MRNKWIKSSTNILNKTKKNTEKNKIICKEKREERKRKRGGNGGRQRGEEKRMGVLRAPS